MEYFILIPFESMWFQATLRVLAGAFHDEPVLLAEHGLKKVRVFRVKSVFWHKEISFGKYFNGKGKPRGPRGFRIGKASGKFTRFFGLLVPLLSQSLPPLASNFTSQPTP